MPRPKDNDLTWEDGVEYSDPYVDVCEVLARIELREEFDKQFYEEDEDDRDD